MRRHACLSNAESAAGAVCEAVNECQAGNSPPDTGGVAAPSRKRSRSAAAQTGWLGLTNCFRVRSLEAVPLSTTPSAPSKEASRLLLDVASTPPMPGGEWRAQFIHTFCDRTYFLGSRKRRAVIDRACKVVFLILCFNGLVQAGEKVEIDNPWVRVIRITQAPHEKSERHARPASVSVYLTDLHQT